MIKWIVEPHPYFFAFTGNRYGVPSSTGMWGRGELVYRHVFTSRTWNTQVPVFSQNCVLGSTSCSSGHVADITVWDVRGAWSLKVVNIISTILVPIWLRVRHRTAETSAISATAWMKQHQSHSRSLARYGLPATEQTIQMRETTTLTNDDQSILFPLCYEVAR